MTVAAALIVEDGVWLAADSQSSNGGERLPGISKLTRKVLQGRPLVITTAGRRTLLDFTRHDLQFPDPGPHINDIALERWAYRVSVELCKLAVNAQPPVLDQDGAIDGMAMLAYRGRLWFLGELSAVPVTTEYQSIGSGSSYALGAFDGLAAAGVLHDDPERSVRLAVEAGIKWDVNCGGPIDVEFVAT